MTVTVTVAGPGQCLSLSSHCPATVQPLSSHCTATVQPGSGSGQVSCSGPATVAGPVQWLYTGWTVAVQWLDSVWTVAGQGHRICQDQTARGRGAVVTREITYLGFLVFLHSGEFGGFELC